jgi:CheY-like chemotaxis protein/anti-sigma regulatory factor (Ser/Thr protein kinase)
MFFADRSQLELALVNLIINARDAMPDGGRIAVTIAAAGSLEDWEAPGGSGEYLCIEVVDEGTGIPASVVERITEPFFTTKEVGKGTGLGLSMVAGFVQQSGGSIEIASEEGTGTTVRLRMPAVRQSSRSAAGDGDIVPVASSSLSRVLIVDDDPSVRLIIGEQLRELGAEVSTAACGSEALELIAGREAFEVLLTDYAMPGLNGLRLVQQARILCPTLRCAVMTGYADDKLEAAVPAGIRLMRKPIAPADLGSLLACAASAD